MATTLQVSTPEGDSGRLHHHSTASYLFRYHDSAEARAAISLLMPVRLDEYRYRELHPIFQMNLPEGYVLEQLRNRLAKVANVDPMLLLALSGSSSPIGRVAVSSHEVDTLLKRQRFPGEKLEEILAWDGAEDIFADLVDRYILRAGISGVQPKVLVPEHLDSAPQRFTSKTSDLIIKSGRDEFPGWRSTSSSACRWPEKRALRCRSSTCPTTPNCSSCAVSTVMSGSTPWVSRTWPP